MKNISGNVRKKRYESTISWEYRIHNKRICAGSFPRERSIYNGEFLVEDRAEKAFDRAPVSRAR